MPVTVAGGCRLAVDVTSQTNPEGAESRAAWRADIELNWDATSVSVTEGSTRTVSDFSIRQRRTVDQTSRTYFVQPFHELVGARWMEAHNQEHVYSVLKAGGLADNDFSAPLVEHELSVQLPKSRTKLLSSSFLSRLTRGPHAIVVSDDAVETSLKFGSRMLMSFSREGCAGVDACAAFIHFLQTRFGGHPLLLARLRAGGRIPRVLTLSSLVPMHKGGEVRVRFVETIASSDSTPMGAHQVPPPLDGSLPVDNVLFSDAWREAPAATPAERLDQSLALMRAGEPLQGLLAFLELTLEVPVVMPAELAAAVNQCTHADVELLLRLVGPPKDEAGGRVALQEFDALRSRAGSRAYLLGPFEAAVRAALGEREQARQLLTAAVVANPRLTGAYKDLGDLFLRDFDASRAWLCWTRARDIAPTLGMLVDVSQFERRLEAENPQYFSR